MTGESGGPAALPGPGVTRRQTYSASTKRALVDVAEQLFGEHGYAGTSLEAIVGGAEVTKGALYHHFSGKQALFEAVLERLVTASATEMTAAVERVQEPWDRARAGVTAFLRVMEGAGYRRIVAQDGPVVLGRARLGEHERLTTYAVVADLAATVLVAGSWAPDQATVDTFARVFHGALSAAGDAVAAAHDPVAEAARVHAVLDTVIVGLQAWAASGGPSS